jgi:hypothetical protein
MLEVFNLQDVRTAAGDRIALNRVISSAQGFGDRTAGARSAG